MHVSNSLFTCTWFNIEKNKQIEITPELEIKLSVCYETLKSFSDVFCTYLPKKLKMLFFAFVLQCKTFTIKIKKNKQKT